MSIQALPQTVLDGIFTLASTSSPRGGELASSLVISHVGRQWRTLALTTPQLWTILHITPRSKVQMVKEIIPRSAGCELYLVFAFPPRNRTPYNRIREISHSRDIISLLVPHSSRWRALTVDANPDRFRTIMRLIENVPLPTLQYLEVKQNGQADITHHGPMHLNADALSTLRLHRVTIHTGGSSAPFSGLRGLELSQTDCRMIDQATLDALGGVDNPSHRPTMLNLQHLSIIAEFPIFPLHPSFQPSSLVSLTLGGFLSTDHVFLAHFVQFFAAISDPNLRHLKLYKIVDTSWDAFLQSLQPTPHISPRYAGLQTLTLESLRLRGIDNAFAGAFPAINAIHLIDVDPSPLLTYFRNNPSQWRDVSVSVGSELLQPEDVMSSVR